MQNTQSGGKTALEKHLTERQNQRTLWGNSHLSLSAFLCIKYPESA